MEKGRAGGSHSIGGSKGGNPDQTCRGQTPEGGREAQFGGGLTELETASRRGAMGAGTPLCGWCQSAFKDKREVYHGLFVLEAIWFHKNATDGMSSAECCD